MFKIPPPSTKISPLTGVRGFKALEQFFSVVGVISLYIGTLNCTLLEKDAKVRLCMKKKLNLGMTNEDVVS